MLKAKKYDWKDSNMALFGSDTEKKIKKESAEAEPAWENAGQEVGLKIWRINKFKVESWPEEDYGQFYSGDSYIILNTYKEEDSDELKYDVHFWIGKHSTQDEYGTAAYKTVELDTFLDDKPIQHREVEGHESATFKSYFEGCITYMKGGADTGFRRVLPEEYTPRLFHVKQDSNKRLEAKERPLLWKAWMALKPGGRLIQEISLKRSHLTSDDVFVLETGNIIYQWNGAECSHAEKFKAAQFVNTLGENRQGRQRKEVLEEESTSPAHPFYQNLRDDPQDDDGDDDDDDVVGNVNAIFKVSDAGGSLDWEKVAEDKDYADYLCSDDVMIIDRGEVCYVWVGKEASVDERRNGLPYAHKYLSKTDHPWAAITVVSEGQAFNIPSVA